MQPLPTVDSILVGIDGAGRAEHALARGLELARELGARIHAVHAVEMPRPTWIGMPGDQLAAMSQRALEEARRRAQQLVAIACRRAAADDLEPEDVVRVESGHPASVILGQAEDLGADLILLGPHQARRRLDFGSTTRAVLTHSPAPVWVQDEPSRAVRRVLVPVDFSDDSRRALLYARALALKLGARIRVMHAHTLSLPRGGFPDVVAVPADLLAPAREAAERHLEELVGGLDWETPPETTLVEGSPVERILVESRAADLVVLGMHGRTGLGRFLVGSVAYGVLRRAERPVLVVPNPRRRWLLPAPLFRARRRAEARTAPHTL